MSNRFAVEAVNRTIQDICDNSDSFVGKCIIFSGDSRQTLQSKVDGSLWNKYV